MDRPDTAHVGPTSGSNPPQRTIVDAPHGNCDVPPPRRRPFVEWRRELGLSSCPYLVRWLLDLRLFSIRLHHWQASDDLRHPHDHPWSFLTIVLKGSYIDAGSEEFDLVKAGDVRFRRATHQHSVMIPPGGAWTLLVTGPQKRKWGFWVNGKFRKANKYFFMHGHHPCE